MEFLTTWIANILMFIMLAVVVEMLLPQSSMQKYVKFVLGLLLMIIILNPIFQLFSVDTNDLLKQAQKFNLEDIALENSIENKKIEIQEQQAAYILEQTAVHLKEITEKELMEGYNLQFADIQIEVKEGLSHPSNDLQNVLEHIDVIEVTLQEAHDEKTIEPVEVVVINTDKQPKEPSTKNEGAIAGFLAEFWGIDMETIQLTFEGGQGLNE